MANFLENLRAFARGELSESALSDSIADTQAYDFEGDEEFMQECFEACLPTLVQMELMDEDAEKRGWTDRLRTLRKKSRAAIGLILDGDDVMTRITALSLGADICLKRDIQAVELIALIKAIIRRRELETEDKGMDELSFGDLRLCRSEHTAFSGDKPLGLTPNEFDFLIYMMEQGRAVTKEELLREVWKTDDSYLLVNVTGDLVKRLRKKLRKAGSNVYVAAVWGYGYRLEQRTSDIDKSA